MASYKKEHCQKQEELSIVHRFKKMYENFPKDNIDPNTHPDFVIATEKNNKLGIEVTKLYNENTNKKDSATQRKGLIDTIIRSAKSNYENNLGKPIAVSVHFQPYLDIKKPEIDDIAKDIVDLITSNYTDACSRPVRFNSNNPHENVLPKGVSYIQFFSGENYKAISFTSPDGGYLPDLDFDTIKEAVDSKEDKITSYLKNCDEIWLLLSIDGFEISNNFDDIDKNILHQTITTDFHKIFIVRQITYYELVTIKSTI